MERAVRSCERALFAIGVACLAVYGAACSHSAWWQLGERSAFEQALVQRIHAEQHDDSAWSAARKEHFEAVAARPVEAIGRLDVPEAAVSVMVLDGTDEVTLNRAVGHIEGTAKPGEHGNVGIAGHRDSFFRGLRHLEVGDRLSLTTLDGVSHYEVERLEVVEPTAIEVLEPTDHEALTLVTCYPFYYVGEAPQRYVVRARQVRYEPWSQRAALQP